MEQLGTTLDRPTTALCTSCRNRQRAATEHPDTYARQATEHVMDSRQHEIRIAVWTSCSACSAGAR